MNSIIFQKFYNLFGYNEVLFIFLNKLSNQIPFFPIISEILSKIFFIGNFAIIYVIFCIYCILRFRKSHNKEQEFWDIYYQMVQIGTTYALFGLSYAAMKFSINLPRPFCALNDTDFITIIDTSFERCLSSFPSAHVGLGLIITYYLWPYLNRVSKLFAIILILLIALARITLAMHFPSDLIFSTLIVGLIIILSQYMTIFLKKLIIMPIGKIIQKNIFKS